MLKSECHSGASFSISLISEWSKFSLIISSVKSLILSPPRCIGLRAAGESLSLNKSFAGNKDGKWKSKVVTWRRSFLVNAFLCQSDKESFFLARWLWGSEVCELEFLDVCRKFCYFNKVCRKNFYNKTNESGILTFFFKLDGFSQNFLNFWKFCTFCKHFTNPKIWKFL